jgi:ubiquinone/menaquinone biosynthesis C-methylase UbiE
MFARPASSIYNTGMETKRYRAIAEYYDPENERLAWLQHDVPFFLRQLPKSSQDVLELATGTARAAIPIAQAGHRVVGVDYAQDMLDIARRKRDAVGLTDRQLTLLYADVMELDLGRRFDWIAIFFNTFLGFTTLAQQDAVLQVVRKHLKPRGRFWLDIFQANLALMASEESMGIDPAVFYVPEHNRTVYMDVDVKRDPSKQLQRVTFNYRWFDPRGRERRQRTRFDLTFIFPRELQILLERNGFVIEKLFGDHDGKDLNADSPRLIARCRLA